MEDHIIVESTKTAPISPNNDNLMSAYSHSIDTSGKPIENSQVQQEGITAEMENINHNDGAIAIELQAHEHDISSKLHNVTKMGNDKEIAIEYQRNHIDIANLTKGNINKNDFITKNSDNNNID